MTTTSLNIISIYIIVEDLSIFPLKEYLNLLFTPAFIINYDKGSDSGYALIVYVYYPEYIQPLHKDLPFLPETIN